MLTDVLIDLQSHDRPLSTAARALGAAGINIDGLSGPSTVDDKLAGHLLVEDAAAASRVLEDAGVKVLRCQDVLVADIADRPGGLSELYDRAGFSSVDFAYLTARGQIVIGIEDPDKLRDAREKLG